MVALAASPAQSNGRADQSSSQGGCHEQPQGGCHGVTPDELARSINPAVAVRPNGAELQKKIDVLRELLGCRISPLWLFVQCLKHDQLEITGKQPLELCRRCLPRFGDVHR